MAEYLRDPDVTLYQGDVIDCLRELPDESVHMVVTSPPYWGLRDYGTGTWEGGSAECEHRVGGQVQDNKAPGAITTGQRPGVDASRCLLCGARRIDQQLGLEPTPQEFVARMVEVFEEVRRVLRDDGTLWLNIGDSYTSGGRADYGPSKPDKNIVLHNAPRVPQPPGLKPKDLCGIPWRLAFALQDAGWYLRSDVIWAKPNPMPESVTDRPTKAHEYVFLLTKQPRYFFDQEAVREAYLPSSVARSAYALQDIRSGSTERVAGEKGPKGETMVRREYPPLNPSGRNIRSVWEIATEAFPEAHFATFPQALVERTIKAGTSERGVCPECGAPWRRMVERTPMVIERSGMSPYEGHSTRASGKMVEPPTATTTGWEPTCECLEPFERLAEEIGLPQAVVLDPFMGSGTTALVARRLGRRSIGIDLNPDYLAMAARRLSQLSLLADAEVA